MWWYSNFSVFLKNHRGISYCSDSHVDHRFTKLKTNILALKLNFEIPRNVYLTIYELIEFKLCQIISILKKV